MAIPIKLNGFPGIGGTGSIVLPGAELSPYAPLAIYLQATLIDAGSPYGVVLSPGLELCAVA